MTEKFKKTWNGWVRSSDGYAVRVHVHSGITYQDDRGVILIDSESMSSPWNEVVVYTRSIADTPDRTRTEVLERLQRAFDFAGWVLTREDR